jgi:tetratricopeptide (TPR) repeat protein
VRASSSAEAVPLALDGVKTVLAYLGEAERLREVIAELTPLLREQRSTWLLQWAVFETSFAAAADGAWDEARALVEDALEINRNSGFMAYAGYFRAHLGWYERLSGDLDAAIAHGRTAFDETSPVDHPWWYATAAGLLASTLLEAGEPREAEALARRGLAVAGPEAPEAWRMRCLAPLSAIDGPVGDNAYAEARRLLDAIECPPGKAWVIGADCYLLVARAARQRDDAAGAERALAPLHLAVQQGWDAVRGQVEEQLAQISSATS